MRFHPRIQFGLQRIISGQVVRSLRNAVAESRGIPVPVRAHIGCLAGEELPVQLAQLLQRIAFTLLVGGEGALDGDEPVVQIIGRIVGEILDREGTEDFLLAGVGNKTLDTCCGVALSCRQGAERRW